MSLAGLQSWLLTDGIRQDLATVTKLMIRSEIDNLVEAKPKTAEQVIDWPRLLLAGSILAKSTSREEQEGALRIAVAAITLTTSHAIRDAGAVLLGKLSNNEAVLLAEKRQLLAGNLNARLGITLRMEAQRQQMDGSVLVHSDGSWLNLNKFQKLFWQEATKKDWISASAPTASGKTFVVLRWLVDQIVSGNFSVCIYLAPTRALVTEIETRLTDLINETDSIEISSLPSAATYRTAAASDRRLILVLTQERVHLLANALGGEFIVDLIIVDEAHKIGDGGRGIILQDAIERATRQNPKLKLAFISPATQNPEELLADAPSGIKVEALEYDSPTVLQNLILAKQLPGKSTRWALEAIHSKSVLTVGTLKLRHAPETIVKRLAFVAAAAGQRGGTLVYANGAAEAEDIADLISQLQPKPPVEAIDAELAALADLARKGVHPKFRLAPLVERGVAFHFGNMPSLIRIEIERLFRSGKLRFLVCTSTLIEGVNLSCRTIVIRGPRKGRKNPMQPHDFWNLAGRAGRWGDEFQGNIICLDPDNKTAWPDGVPRRAKYPIKRESDAVLELGDSLLEYLRLRADNAAVEPKTAQMYEQVGAYLLTLLLRNGSLIQTDLAKRHPHSYLNKLEVPLLKIASSIEIDVDLASRHPGISALGMQRLLMEFRAYKRDPENLLLAETGSDDGHDRFSTIMRRINATLYPAFLPDKRVGLYAIIVVRWLSGQSLAEIIRRNISWHEENKRAYKLEALIRETMELVEEIARFRAPKYISAYIDVLHLHLNTIGRSDLTTTGIDIGTQLEFGVSSKTLVSLIELGLSRMSAVELFSKIAQDDLTQEECREWVLDRSSQLDSMDLPAVIVREVRERLLS